MNRIAPDAVYARIFQQDGDGAAILQDLATEFYDTPLFDSDPLKMAFNLGQRQVVKTIMDRSAQAEV